MATVRPDRGSESKSSPFGRAGASGIPYSESTFLATGSSHRPAPDLTGRAPLCHKRFPTFNGRDRYRPRLPVQALRSGGVADRGGPGPGDHPGRGRGDAGGQRRAAAWHPGRLGPARRALRIQPMEALREEIRSEFFTRLGIAVNVRYLGPRVSLPRAGTPRKTPGGLFRPLCYRIFDRATPKPDPSHWGPFHPDTGRRRSAGPHRSAPSH